MKDTLLHTGGVVGSIPTAPTSFSLYYQWDGLLVTPGSFPTTSPKRTELDENTGGGLGEALALCSTPVLHLPHLPEQGILPVLYYVS
jgi:hypothetical protein